MTLRDRLLELAQMQSIVTTRAAQADFAIAAARMALDEAKAACGNQKCTGPLDSEEVAYNEACDYCEIAVYALRAGIR